MTERDWILLIAGAAIGFLTRFVLDVMSERRQSKGRARERRQVRQEELMLEMYRALEPVRLLLQHHHGRRIRGEVDEPPETWWPELDERLDALDQRRAPEWHLELSGSRVTMAYFMFQLTETVAAAAFEKGQEAEFWQYFGMVTDRADDLVELLQETRSDPSRLYERLGLIRRIRQWWAIRQLPPEARGRLQRRR